MKITFEGKTIGELLDQMQETLREFQIPATVPAQVSAPVDKPVTNPVRNLVEKAVARMGEKPQRVRTERQLANDERLRAAAQEKKAKGKPFFKKEKAVPAAEKPMPPPPATAESLGLDPAEVVNIRQKTITDLQEAYANGKQQEVFELLSRFGNGAKSFRELPPESFVPIREAIDLGALT